MLKKFVFVLKYLGIATGVLIGVISCENDFRNVGVNIVDNNIFATDSDTYEVVAYTKDIDSNQSNALNHYLLGVQRDDVFGKLEASVVTQLILSETNPDFGMNAVIDSVVVDIPFLSTLNGEHENGTPQFDLDSVWTAGDKTIQLSVYELGTYLNSVDPQDPTEQNKYYSGNEFLKVNPLMPFYDGIIAPSDIDTLLLVKRYKYPNYPDLTQKEVYQTDTIQHTNQQPSLKIPIDKAQIKSIIQDNASGSDFASNANFQHFFRGLYFEVLETSIGNEALMTLDLSDAKMTIYYSNDVEDDEDADEDLDGDGITGEENVTVRTPEELTLTFGNIISNLYARDYTGDIVESYINSANQTDGEELLFVQGAAGTNAIIKLFGDEDVNGNNVPDELDALREKNWLINDAQLTFYIAPDNATNWIPQRLFLYNITNNLNEDGEEENTQLLDALSQDAGYLGGTLEYDDDDEPEKYTFHITDFISALVKPDSELILYDLGLKVYDVNDVALSVNDTIIRHFDTNPKGLSLIGNLLSSSDEKRLKLEIFYSEINN